jgi:hypothetical protein
MLVVRLSWPTGKCVCYLDVLLVWSRHLSPLNRDLYLLRSVHVVAWSDRTATITTFSCDEEEQDSDTDSDSRDNPLEHPYSSGSITWSSLT